MNKRFLHSNQEFPAIERKNFILSIISGVFFSFVFYSFLCLSREIIRLFSITEKYDIWILSDHEVNFYNLFFAYLSLFFAQSICFSQWFGRARKPFEKTNILKSAIVNDQWFLNTVFLCWFSRYSTLYALFIGIASGGGFYVFSFYPKYNFLFILILIVLFLQMWVTIRRVYKRKALKWILISALFISVLAFTYSRINLVDYHAINKIVLEKNIAYKYKLELAEVNSFNYSYRSFRNEIYAVKPSETAIITNPLIFFNGEELPFDSLEQKLLMLTKSTREYIYVGFCRLHIDKSIKMSFVNHLKEIMTNAGFRRVEYAVIPKTREYDERYYNCYSSWGLIDRNSYENDDTSEYNILSVSCFSDSVQINNILSHKKDFYSKIKQQVEKYDNYLVTLLVENEMTFADYIFVLSEYRRAVETIRNEYAIREYSTEYELLDLEKSEIIRNKKPLWLKEIDNTSDFSQAI